MRPVEISQYSINPQRFVKIGLREAGLMWGDVWKIGGLSKNRK